MPSSSLSARCVYLGGRLLVRGVEGRKTVRRSPLTVEGRDGGLFVVFRFGALVGLGTGDQEMDEVRSLLETHVLDRDPTAEEERVELTVDPEGPDDVGPEGEILLSQLDLDRANVVANVIAKSTVLAHYEREVAMVFDRVEGLAIQLRDGAGAASGRELMKEIGQTLLIQTHMVGRVEVREKPGITWTDPLMDRLYGSLAHEYELTDRDRALSRKLDLISDVAGTYLELVDTRKSLRLEWYIVILILVEIVILVWDLTGKI